MLSKKQLIISLFLLGIVALAFAGAWELFGTGGLIKTSIHHGGSASGISFNNQIQPILSENCYRCHGTDSAARKAGLRLDREEEATAPRPGHQPAIVKGHPEESELVRRISSSKPTVVMPPPDSHKSLKPEEIALLTEWIREGARYEPHWSLVKPVRPPVPQVRKTDWGNNPIDKFVLSRMETEGLEPEFEADPRTLIRRVTLDLTGLPPRPEEVEAFVKDPSKEHYEKIVDDLLARPSFGEHEGRIWLDAARYADTVGLHIDNYRSIWPYRDWVVQAFNDNLPYDRFVTEQLAGDLFPNPTDNQKIATAFLRCQETTSEGGTIPDEVAANMAAEEVDAVSTVYLGASMKCCACHDHKFDPYTQKDFYRMSAFFRNSTTPIMDGRRFDTPPILFIPANDADKARVEALDLEEKQANADVKKANADLKMGKKTSPDQKKSLTESLNKAKDRLEALQSERKELLLRGKVCLIEEEKKNSNPTAYVLKRGQYDMKEEQVSAGVPSIFPQIPKDQPQNRLGLAKWITSPDNPFTARVFVNRLWQQFFGIGIVKTSEDLGIMGERPVNQPLLDWLAVEFRENGWDMKKIMRKMVTSAAYKQSPVITDEKRIKDPENRLVSRGPRFRMEGEMIRDQALAASGLLNPQIGGPSVKTYQPPGLWEAVTMPESDTKKYVQDTGDKIYRRSMYLFWKRQSPPPELETMGSGTREVCSVRRLRTDTPLQSLETMNDPQFLEASRKLAVDAIKTTNDPSERLNYISERLIARPFNQQEKDKLLATEQKISSHYTAHPDEAQALLTVGQLPPDKTIPAPEQATWTMLASVVLNLDETLNQ